ncbi:MULTISPECIES: tape measure protein [Nitrosomonas]|uniref:Lambda family phage tail tape measure protein n=1 Tax=Nitrosomonas communis TaxID=44574 RepID=A0A5D3YA44_9PROT|nr:MULTISPECIES: tape measure protein [Nitrosomonas]TYP83877.1 lambda family phage tail tape measure protein [Nitrosomonas communis]UVS62011.1 tape measure protein [Nitrosomonas sp. PLL12]
MANKELKITITANDHASTVIGKIRSEFDRLSNSNVGKKIKGDLDGLSTSIDGFRSRFSSLIGGLSTAISIQGFTQLAETSKRINALLRLAAESSDDFTRSQQFAQKTALEVGIAYDSIANLYAKIRMNAGLASGETERMTAIIAKATQIGNQGGPGVDAAIFQLQQGLASGVLRGEELNSVMEQTPALAQAIANGLGISIGQLRKLGEEGKLTTQVVKDALIKMESDINEQFTKLPFTTKNAFQNIRTQAIIHLGKLDEQLGITESFANILQAIANNMQLFIALVAGGIVALTAIFLASSKGALTLSTSVAAVLVALKTLLSPIGLVAAALGGLTAFIVANIDKTAEFSGKTTTLGAVVSAIWRTIKDTVADALRAISQAVGLSGQELNTTFRSLGSVAGGMFNALLEVINAFVTSVFTGLRLIGRAAGISAASLYQQFRTAIANTRALFNALAEDVADAFSGKSFAFDKVGNALSKGLTDASVEAGNFKNALIEAYEVEVKFAEDGGVLSALKKGIAERLIEVKAAEDEFKKRNPNTGTAPTAPSKEELKAAKELAQARRDLEDALFKQTKRLADDQAQREVQTAKELFEFKAISADEYYRRLDRLQTELTNREIAELERQKAIRQAIIDDPRSGAADRLKAIAEITELTTSQAIAERELNAQRSKVANEIAALEATRLKSQQEFIDELKREAFLSSLSKDQRETTLLMMEAQKRGIQDINGLLQIQGKIQANNQARQRAEEILRQQNQIFDHVQRGVQQAFADGLYRVAKGEGGINEILAAIGDSMLRALSNSLAGGFTDMFFNLLGRAGKDGKSAPAGIFSGLFSSMSEGLNGLLGSLKNGLSGIFSSFKGLFSGGRSGIGGFFSGLLSAFSGKGFADGGYTGEGSKYQPAGVVHAGEYVFSAASVRRLGLAALDNLHRLSKGAPVPRVSRMGYAEGGLVEPPTLSPAAAPTVNQSVRIVNSIDPRITKDFLASSEGEKVILNIISRNTAALKQVLA